jgi:hypothetical protein
MNKVLIFAVLTFFCFSAKSQWLWDFGGTAAAANYLGDIGGKEKDGRKGFADLKLAKTRWNFGGFARYKWRPKISFKASVDYLRLEGDDALSTNPGRKYRNFNFRNDIADMAVTAEYFFYENNDLGNTYRYRNGFRAYLFVGFGGFVSNPKTLYKGEWVALQPKATEGVQYKKFVATIPMGVGFYFTLNKKQRIGFEFNYRKTFTDYLDDISGQYPSDPGNDYDRGLIIRTNELSSGVIAENPTVAASHTWGAKRGGDKSKDAFLTVGFTYSYVLRGKSSFYRVRNSGFFSKKRKMRKIRAKF